MTISNLNITIREYLEPLTENVHSPDPIQFLELLVEQGVPEDQLESYVRNAFYTAPLTKRQRLWLKGVLAGLEGAHSD